MKTLYSLILLLVLPGSYAQTSTFAIKKLPEILEGSAIRILAFDTITPDLYREAFSGWPYSSITFETDSNFMDKLKQDKVYMGNIHVSVYSLDYKSLYKSFDYMMIFIPTKHYTNALKKKQPISLSYLKKFAIFPLEMKDFNGVKRYNFGVLKNHLRQIKSAAELGKDINYYRNYHNKDKLALLKTDTLYIVNDHPGNQDFAKTIKDHYPYPYKLISNPELEDAILHTDKNFYYMHFAYTSDLGQYHIGIVNSQTGEEIFHDKIMNPYLQISEKILRILTGFMN